MTSCCLFLAAGCDCYAYGLLAAGHADLVCESDLKPYDYMALIPIIKVGKGVRGSERVCVCVCVPGSVSGENVSLGGITSVLDAKTIRVVYHLSMLPAFEDDMAV